MDVLVRGRLTTLRPCHWDDETFNRGEMEERLAREHVEAWIVEKRGKPIGYQHPAPWILMEFRG